MNIDCMCTHDPEHRQKPLCNSGNEALTDNQECLGQWQLVGRGGGGEDVGIVDLNGRR